MFKEKQMKKALIILGSARSNGNTQKVIQQLQQHTNVDQIDLLQKKLAPFRYEMEADKDDFLPIIKQFINDYELMIIATPVYWYTMSAVMKNFFDRFMVLTSEKELGRQLRGKAMSVISCGSDKLLITDFYNPFRSSAQYLGMTYIGELHSWAENGLLDEENKIAIENYANQIERFLKSID